MRGLAGPGPCHTRLALWRHVWLCGLRNRRCRPALPAVRALTAARTRVCDVGRRRCRGGLPAHRSGAANGARPQVPGSPQPPGRPRSGDGCSTAGRHRSAGPRAPCSPAAVASRRRSGVRARQGDWSNNRHAGGRRVASAGVVAPTCRSPRRAAHTGSLLSASRSVLAMGARGRRGNHRIDHRCRCRCARRHATRCTRSHRTE